MTVRRIFFFFFYCYAGLCLIVLIVYGHYFCCQRQTVRDKVSLIWGLWCFPYCKTWIILQFLFSVTLTKTLISPQQMCCLSHLCCAVGSVLLQRGFLISSSAVNQAGGDYISQQGLKWRIHRVWIRTGYKRTSALGGCLQSWDFKA